MQIIDRHGKTIFKLRLDEARRLRDAAYIKRRAARNLANADEANRLSEAAVADLWLVEQGTTEKQRKTLDQQDAAEPEVAQAETKSQAH